MFRLDSRNFLQYGLLLILLAIVIYVFFFYSNQSQTEQVELQELSTFKEFSTYFEDLAKIKGAIHAFEVLKTAEFPPNIDTHLLGHVVGDELYAQEGVEGIKYCTHHLRNACSHSVVIGALLERGAGALPEVQDACHQAPGGKGAYTMCYHGFGHGVLAYLDYEYPEAVNFCKKVGTEEYGNREYIECVGGVTMEMMAGVHDPGTWEEKKESFMPEGEPLAPCNAEYMPEEVRGICYTYLSPRLFADGGGNLGALTEKDYAHAFALCAQIEDRNDRLTCQGALGKEFIVLSQNYDVRDIENISNDSLQTVLSWCALAGSSEGEKACVTHAVQSLFWGGENDRNAAVRFCILADGDAQERCIDELIGAVSYYIDDGGYRTSFCSELPNTFQNVCREKLL